MPDDLGAEPVEPVEPALEFPVVGIGASAGGLEAVTEMFREADADTGMAFVLVQHLDPNHESMMTELLSRKTRLGVHQIEDGDAIRPDHLHVIPPGHALSVEGGRLRLSGFEEPRGLRRPIDTFFASLGRAQGAMAACVVLSGTGADGSTGMRAIKDAGGVCAVQDAEEARYDGMPSAAAATGLVDFTLSASEMVPRLRDFFARRADPGAADQSGGVAENLEAICSVLRDAVGHDFSGYKRPTMVRRIERRMQILEMPGAPEYLAHLRESAEECDALFRDLLINVTSFFREPATFEALDAHVIRPLVARARAAGEIRVWVPGCSSGQEAYSIAMLLDAALGERGRRPQVQVFATDIDTKMIEIAREARYSASALADIPERLRDDHTIGLDGHFQMTPRLREMVRFSAHSLIKDPPFSKIDLISCCNLLIYLGERVQRAAFPLMHFALREGGHLLLGSSETIGRHTDLFEPVDQRARLFRRKPGQARHPLDLPLGDRRRRPARTYGALPREQDFPADTPPADVHAAVFEAYAPPFVRVDPEGRILSVSGDPGLFLRSQPGAERTLASLARGGLRDQIAPLIGGVHASGGRAALRGVEIASPFGTHTADVVAHALKDGSIAVVFIAGDRLEAELDAYAVAPAERDARVAELEEELHTVRYRLKSTVEEVETANEELKSSNEEMMSMNEELQSANEELTTANEELKNKVDELAQANADLDAFLQSTDMAVVIVDRLQRIRHFTEAAREVFPLQPGDRDRPLGEIAHSVDVGDLPRTVARVIETGEVHERVVRSEDGAQGFMLRVLPYHGPGGAAEGATLTFSDITRLSALEADLRLETQRLEIALGAAAMGVFDVDVDSGEILVDERVAEMFGFEGLSPALDEVFGAIHPEDRAATSAAFAAAVERGQPYEAEFRAGPEGRERWIRGVGARIEGVGGRRKVFGLNYDVTAQHEALVAREILLQEMSHRVKNLFAVLLSLISSMPKRGLSAEDFAEPLKARVAALGHAYDLARTDVQQDAVDFAELARGVLRPHADEAQISLDGPGMRVPVSRLTPLGLILHELATNAMKYGALSRGGRVALSWRHAGEDVELRWTESGGPGGTERAGGGFGTRLIEFSARQLGGTFERSFEGGDMTATLTFAAR